MDEVPDLYADNVSVTIGTNGVTLTLVRSMPGVDPAIAQVGATVHATVGYVRLSPALAQQVGEILAKGIPQAMQGGQGPGGKH